MGWNSPDVVNQPEAFGLTVVGSIEWDNRAYEFNETVILRKGRSFYVAEDSGCSCPQPFEGHTSLDKCERMTKPQIYKYLDERLSYAAAGVSGEVADLKRKIADLK